MEPDFSGWATRSNVLCADGRTIMEGAFAHQDKVKVPLVWQHQHEGVENILGHAILEKRAGGMYCYGYFNESEAGQDAKEAVRHGDLDAMSIFANKLKERNKHVSHGIIREVSLVIAGANEEARIENVYIQHGDSFDVIEGEAIIHTGLLLEHADDDADSASDEGADMADENNDEQTVEKLLEGLTADQLSELIEGLPEEQKAVVRAKVAEAAKDGEGDDNDESAVEHSDDLISGEEILAHINQEIQKGFQNMHNIFDTDGDNGGELKHNAVMTADDVQKLVKAGAREGSIRDALAHAATYGIDEIEILFPDAKAVTSQPELLTRRVEWVDKVLKGTKHQPYAKIKSIVADLTAEEARAKGYIKGNEKKDEVIKLLKRTTGPATVYKKQKLDRDDIIDITDFDVIVWLKWEIRYMLDEEIARAILIGDGRSAASDDKIKDPEGAIDGVGIRSIFHDHELYAHQVTLPANVNATDTIDEVVRARNAYRGSGTPTWYTTDKALTDLLLLKDKFGRRLYDTEAALASALRVKEIVSVEVFEEEPELLGILVNLIDYTVGTNKGGEVNFFDDFDIDFNQQKYLMETRISGALTRPKSAVVVRRQQGTAATPSAPTFADNTITIVNTTGIDYYVDGVKKTGNVAITEDALVEAEPKDGYYIPFGSTRTWSFTHTA